MRVTKRPEIEGRDVSEFPHPKIRETIERFADRPPAERRKVRFIHLNRANPAHWSESEARRVFLRSPGARE